MKVLLDTNVLISGLMLPESIPGRIIRAWRGGQFDLVMSDPLLDELTRVLAYPKIKKRLMWSQQDIETFILLLRFKTYVVDIEGIDAVVPDDADDNKVLATYLAAEADILVSGDSDLLALADRHTVETPGDFAEHL